MKRACKQESLEIFFYAISFLGFGMLPVQPRYTARVNLICKKALNVLRDAAAPATATQFKNPTAWEGQLIIPLCVSTCPELHTFRLIAASCGPYIHA